MWHTRSAVGHASALCVYAAGRQACAVPESSQPGGALGAAQQLQPPGAPVDTFCPRKHPPLAANPCLSHPACLPMLTRTSLKLVVRLQRLLRRLLNPGSSKMVDGKRWVWEWVWGGPPTGEGGCVGGWWCGWAGASGMPDNSIRDRLAQPPKTLCSHPSLAGLARRQPPRCSAGQQRQAGQPRPPPPRCNPASRPASLALIHPRPFPSICLLRPPQVGFRLVRRLALTLAHCP